MPPPPPLVTIFRTFVGGLGNSGGASDGDCGGESGAVDPMIRICLRRSGAARLDRGGEEGKPGRGLSPEALYVTIGCSFTCCLGAKVIQCIIHAIFFIRDIGDFQLVLSLKKLWLLTGLVSYSVSNT